MLLIWLPVTSEMVATHLVADLGFCGENGYPSLPSLSLPSSFFHSRFLPCFFPYYPSCPFPFLQWGTWGYIAGKFLMTAGNEIGWLAILRRPPVHELEMTVRLLAFRNVANCGKFPNPTVPRFSFCLKVRHITVCNSENMPGFSNISRWTAQSHLFTQKLDG